jgi:hypothetical protein
LGHGRQRRVTGDRHKGANHTCPVLVSARGRGHRHRRGPP